MNSKAHTIFLEYEGKGKGEMIEPENTMTTLSTIKMKTTKVLYNTKNEICHTKFLFFL